MLTAKSDACVEVWKSPPSLGCKRVEVSNLGRVRTLNSIRTFHRLGVERSNFVHGKIVKLHRDTRGRWMLQGTQIKKEFFGKGFLLHRLVAECFVRNPKPDEYKFVFFKDNNIANCRADNLVWGSWQEYNIKRRGRSAQLHIKVYKKGVFVGEYSGAGEVGRAIHATKQAVWASIKSGSNICKGFVLKVVDGSSGLPQKTIVEARKIAKSEEIVAIPDSLYA